jgi:hypothetical protein
MIVAFVVALAVVAGAVWLLVRQSRARNRPPEPKRVGGRFGGVEIRLRGGACDAARALEGQRFLAKDAPALPLSDCTAAQCTCSFTKLSDRRTDGRRIEHAGLSASLFEATNRRSKRDRRRAAQPPRRG